MCGRVHQFVHVVIGNSGRMAARKCVMNARVAHPLGLSIFGLFAPLLSVCRMETAKADGPAEVFRGVAIVLAYRKSCLSVLRTAVISRAHNGFKLHILDLNWAMGFLASLAIFRPTCLILLRTEKWSRCKLTLNSIGFIAKREQRSTFRCLSVPYIPMLSGV